MFVFNFILSTNTAIENKKCHSNKCHIGCLHTPHKDFQYELNFFNKIFSYETLSKIALIYIAQLV
jgi:hypothetical protein